MVERNLPTKDNIARELVELAERPTLELEAELAKWPNHAPGIAAKHILSERAEAKAAKQHAESLIPSRRGVFIAFLGIPIALVGVWYGRESVLLQQPTAPAVPAPPASAAHVARMPASSATLSRPPAASSASTPPK